MIQRATFLFIIGLTLLAPAIARAEEDSTAASCQNCTSWCQMAYQQNGNASAFDSCANGCSQVVANCSLAVPSGGDIILPASSNIILPEAQITSPAENLPLLTTAASIDPEIDSNARAITSSIANEAQVQNALDIALNTTASVQPPAVAVDLEPPTAPADPVPSTPTAVADVVESAPALLDPSVLSKADQRLLKKRAKEAAELAFAQSEVELAQTGLANAKALGAKKDVKKAENALNRAVNKMMNSEGALAKLDEKLASHGISADKYSAVK